MARQKIGPFMVRGPNGLNFSKSVNDSNSRLVRVVRYLRKHPGQSRRTLNRQVLSMPVWNTSFDGGPIRIQYRGWASIFWAAAVKAGFIVKVVKGNDVRYYVGPTADLIR